MSRLYPKKFRLSLKTALLLFILLLLYSFPARSADYTLTVTTAGAGVGTVNSAPSGISCQSGVSSGCIAVFNDVDPVTLLPAADWKSFFDGWSGGVCNGNGNCVITLTGDTVETATFSPNFQAHLVSSDMPQQYYDTIAAAYADATEFKFNIVAYEHIFHENLVLDKPLYIYFGGGRLGLGYLSHRDDHFTTIQGSLDVQSGSIEIDSLIIQ